MKFYVVEKIGEKRAFTPEGFLLIEDVPVARTGTMIYGPHETPIQAGTDGLVRVHREPQEVFNPTYIASLEAKPITNDHPENEVNPDNYTQLTCGTMLNVRRGTGVQADLLIADLLVCERNAIKDVLDGKVEVSLGYEADYEEIQVGEGRQLNMIGNHVALVEAGRCGPRCSIGDSNNLTKKETIMAKKGKSGVWDKLLEAFGAKDATELEEKMKAEDAGEPDGDEGNTHVHVHLPGTATDEDTEEKGKAYDAEATESRFKSIEDSLEEIKKTLDSLTAGEEAKTTDSDEEEGKTSDEDITEEMKDELPEEVTKDAKFKITDSAPLLDSYKETVAEAEILVPGIRVPAFDSKARPRATFDAICNMRNKALELAYVTPEGNALIEDVLGGKRLALDGMSCSEKRTLFKSVVAAKKAVNRDSQRHASSVRNQNNQEGKKKVTTIADLNNLNREHYAKR